MRAIDTDSIPLLAFDILTDRPSVRHFVTTRAGGRSAPPYAGLNLGLHVGDDESAVVRNRERLASAAGAPLRYFTFANQTHGDRVAVVTDSMRGLGASEHASALPDTDAMITNAPDICLTVLVADCVPILLYDPTHQAVGAVHAGWRGTANGIVARAVEAMADAYGTSPSDVLAAIGPSIGPCCYEVSPDVADAFAGYPTAVRNIDGSLRLSLWDVNKTQLLNSGLPEESIEVAGGCTCCNVDRFYSYRSEGTTGRFAAGIYLLNEQCASCTAMHCSWCSRP